MTEVVESEDFVCRVESYCCFQIGCSYLEVGEGRVFFGGAQNCPVFKVIILLGTMLLVGWNLLVVGECHFANFDIDRVRLGDEHGRGIVNKGL